MKTIGNLFLPLLLICSCASKPINKYEKVGDHQLRSGWWEEQFDSDEGVLVARGKYRMGERTGIWKWTLDGKKYQKDVIRKNIISTKFYYPSGKIMSKGHSRTEISDQERFWYYSGTWEFYDERGRLTHTKNYIKGHKMDSVYAGRPSK